MICNMDVKTIQWGEFSLFSKWYCEETSYPHGKEEGGPLPNTINKIKSKWIKDLNIKLLNS